MTALLLVGLLAGQFEADLQTRAHLRLDALDSAAVTWFETRPCLVFKPINSDKVDARIGIELRVDGFPGLTSISQLGRPGAFEPVSVLLGETYVRVYDALPGFNLTLGRQLVRWGTADAVNPTDNLVTPDYSDPLTWDARRPVWMAHAEYAPSQFLGLEVAAKPVFEPAMSVSRRWFWVDNLPTVDVLRQGLVQRLVGQGLDTAMARQVASLYTITVTEDFQLPRNRLRDMTFGGRVKTQFSVLDLSASVLRGYDFLPSADPVTVIDTQALALDFTLRERYARRTVVGGDASANLAGVGLWAEAAYSIYDDSLPESGVSVIGGGDYTLAGFYFNAQYLHGQFPLALAQTRGEPTKDFVLGAVERKLAGERLLVRAGGAVDVKHGSFALLPLVRWMPGPGLELDLGALVFSGEPGTAFASLDGNDEVFLGGRYRF
jgi:hypothetical protein